ncbi:MAG: 50S ribosomal protein L21 [Clostridia bacterium]|nr:50S ribosomal protein L21 [Clostridia bacterium]
MYAIFENGGKQYKACVGDLVKVEKLNRKTGETVEFPVILTADEKGIKVSGDAAGLKVKAEVVSEGKDKKIIVFKYKPKKNERKKQGHRQPYTLIKVTAIGDVAEVKPTAKKTATEKKPAAKTAAAEKSAVKKAPAKKATEAKAKAE